MSTVTITVADQTRNSLHELAMRSGKTEQELITEALDKYLAIREFYELRRQVIENSGLAELPSDEEIFDMVS